MSTIVAPLEHSPLEDAEVIYQACKGWGTDEKAIISILGHRTAYQRQQIRRAYQELHQEDLVKRLESELSGDFERAVYRWILEPADRDAVLAHVALKKLHPAVIIEITCVLCPEELLAVRRAYQARYQHSLEEDVAAHTTGDMRKLLVGLVSAYRYAGPEINERLAKTEAEILHEAIKHHDYEETIRILTTRSKAQLIATFNRYRDEHSSSITKNLSDFKHQEFSAALRTIIRCFIDPTKYYEKVIRNALKGIGSDEGALTRVIVTQAEKDLRQIKEAYYNRNSVFLEHAVAKETSGDYKHFLLTLIGQEG